MAKSLKNRGVNSPESARSRVGQFLASPNSSALSKGSPAPVDRVRSAGGGSTGKTVSRAQKYQSRRPSITAETVLIHALDTFGSQEKTDHWLARSNPLFSGKTPRELLESEPASVEAALVRIDYGVYV